MSIMRCENCQKNIDTDFDAEHFPCVERPMTYKELRKETMEVESTTIKRGFSLEYCLGFILKGLSFAVEIERRDRENTDFAVQIRGLSLQGEKEVAVKSRWRDCLYDACIDYICEVDKIHAGVADDFLASEFGSSGENITYA